MYLQNPEPNPDEWYLELFAWASTGTWGAPGAPQGHIYGSAKVELAFKKPALDGKLEERQGEKSCDYDLIFDRARDPSAAPVLSLASQGSQASIPNQHDTFGGEGQAIPGFKGYPRSPGDSTSSGMKKEQHGNEPCEGPPRSPRDPPIAALLERRTLRPLLLASMRLTTELKMMLLLSFQRDGNTLSISVFPPILRTLL